MKLLRATVDELLGLFVDDGSFAAAIVVWLLAAGLTLPRVDLAAAAKGAILFSGLAVVLVLNVLRRARG
jgi:hypothetical protein